MRPLLITIDGPAGAGKTTISRRLADCLNYTYVDTGALYRGVALAALNGDVAPGDDDGLARLCRMLQLSFERVDGILRLILNGEDITDRIRTPKITMLASAVSARPVVREFLLSLQRNLGRSKRAVFEGRDMGTVVFPDADVKFYLVADLEERARRRFLELGMDSGQDLSEVHRDMEKRDRNDSSRAVAPLKPAPDAIPVDSTRLSVDEVIDRMLSEIRAAG